MGAHHPGQADEHKGKTHLQGELAHRSPNNSDDKGNWYDERNDNDLIAPHLESMRRDPNRENRTRGERRRINRLLNGIT
jgi:hypothetical protein